MPIRRPLVVAFDVIETLFRLDAIGERFGEVGLPVEKLPLWFCRVLRDGFALDASGVFRSFVEVAASTLEVFMDEEGVRAERGKIERVMQGFSAMRAQADAGPALRRVKERGGRAVALTHGSAENTQKLLAGAGVEGTVERVISIDEVRHWKPRAEVYRHAAGVCGVATGEMALVAAHAWDTQGAGRAGLMTGWVARQEKRFPPAMDAPDVRGATLVEAIDGLMGAD